MDLRLHSYEQDDDTDEGGEILENDDEINRKALEEKRKQKRNCKIYQVGDILHHPEHYGYSLLQTLAPSVVGLVSDLDYMRTKIQNLRRRWNDIQTSHLNQVEMRGSFKHKSPV